MGRLTLSVDGLGHLAQMLLNVVTIHNLQGLREELQEFKVQIERARSSSEDSIQRDVERMRQEIQAETLNAGIQARKICKEESGNAAQAISVCVDSAVDSLNPKS